MGPGWDSEGAGTFMPPEGRAAVDRLLARGLLNRE